MEGKERCQAPTLRRPCIALGAAATRRLACPFWNLACRPLPGALLFVLGGIATVCVVMAILVIWVDFCPVCLALFFFFVPPPGGGRVERRVGRIFTLSVRLCACVVGRLPRASLSQPTPTDATRRGIGEGEKGALLVAGSDPACRTYRPIAEMQSYVANICFPFP